MGILEADAQRTAPSACDPVASTCWDPAQPSGAPEGTQRSHVQAVSHVVVPWAQTCQGRPQAPCLTW